LSLRKNFIEKKKSKEKNKIDRFNWKIRVRVDAQRGERILNWMKDDDKLIADWDKI
jgi:hypothetical protein